jgi:RNA polymerase sigma-70 factor (ECF subfamily)
MRYSEKLIEGGEGVALDATKSPPAEMLSVLSRCLPSLHRYAYRLLGNKADAEDAVQDALLAAYKHLNQFRGEAQLSTWLTTIVINCARMHLRKRSRYIHVSLDSRIGEEREYPLSDTLVDHRPNPEDECQRAWANARLIESAARLSPTLRRAFHLRYVDHLSVCETARVLGVPIGTVKAQTARARAKVLKSIRGILHQGPAERKFCSRNLPHQNGSAVPVIKAETGSFSSHTGNFWRDRSRSDTPRKEICRSAKRKAIRNGSSIRKLLWQEVGSAATER